MNDCCGICPDKCRIAESDEAAEAMTDRDVPDEMATGGYATQPLADWERELLREQDALVVGYPPYDPDKLCPKCGTEDVSTKWHHGHHLWTGYGVTIGRWDMYADCLDWLLRTCTCCAYAWPEAPMDQDPR